MCKHQILFRVISEFVFPLKLTFKPRHSYSMMPDVAGRPAPALVVGGDFGIVNGAPKTPMQRGRAPRRNGPSAVCHQHGLGLDAALNACSRQ
jgi:hypothetical protein